VIVSNDGAFNSKFFGYRPDFFALISLLGAKSMKTEAIPGE